MRRVIAATALLLALAPPAGAARKGKGQPKKPAPAAPAPEAPHPRPAPPPDEPTPAEPRPAAGKPVKSKVYNFTGLDVEGKLKTPQLLFFFDRVKLELDTTAQPKRSFLKELEATSTDKGL